MPLPALIGSDTRYPGQGQSNLRPNNEIVYSEQQQIGVYGPFFVSGAVRYVACLTTSGSYATREYRADIYKSTNGGQTWTRQGTGPLLINALESYEWNPAALYAIEDPARDTIHIIYLASPTDDAVTRIAIRPFDVSTDTWGADAGMFATSAMADEAQPFSAVLRSDGKIVCFHTLLSGSVTHVVYRIWDSGTWSEPSTYLTGQGTEETSQAERAAVAISTSDRAHIFAAGEYSTDPPQQRHVSFAADDSNGTWQVAFEFAFASGRDWRSEPINDAGMVRMAYVAPGGEIRMASATSAENPTWVTELIATSSVLAINRQAPVVALGRKADGTLVAAWINADQEMYWSQKSGTWSDPELLDYGANTLSIRGFGSTFGVVYSKATQSGSTGDRRIQAVEAPVWYTEPGGTPTPPTGARSLYFAI